METDHVVAMSDKRCRRTYHCGHWVTLLQASKLTLLILGILICTLLA